MSLNPKHFIRWYGRESLLFAFYCLLWYKVPSEGSRTVIAVTSSVHEDEQGGQGHTSAEFMINNNKVIICHPPYLPNVIRWFRFVS